MLKPIAIVNHLIIAVKKINHFEVLIPKELITVNKTKNAIAENW
ncbi:Uncharacterised protein, partial [Mycoplasmopsis edwardii]